MTLSEFRIRYPEFEKADDALVSAILDEALVVTPPNIWGDLADRAQGLLTAHLLTLAPHGARGARLTLGAVSGTMYADEWQKLAATRTPGWYRVL